MNKRKKTYHNPINTIFARHFHNNFTYYDRNQTVDKTLPSKNQNNISSKLSNQNNLRRYFL